MPAIRSVVIAPQRNASVGSKAKASISSEMASPPKKTARPSGEIVVSAAPAANVARPEGVDTRPRALPDALTQVVGRYSRPESIKGPNGLGLYICKRIVERHSGVITISSNRPQGARVGVTLPARPNRERPAPPPPERM